MALQVTEDKFTADELVAVLEKTPALANEVKTAMERKKYFVADEATKTTYDQNVENRAKAALTAQHALDIEKDVKEITGIDKTAPDEKYYDYMKRALKGKTESEKALQTKIAALEGKSDITAAERQQLENLRAKVVEKEGEVTNLTTKHQSEITRLKAENKIFSEIGKVKLKTDIDADLLSLKKDTIVSEMISSAKFDNGRLVFFKPDGTAMINAADQSFMTAEQVFSLKMDKYIDKGVQQQGAGGNGEGGDQPVNPGQFKSKTEVDNFLSKKGLTQGTPEFSAEQKKYNYKNLPLE